jgi:hypothetical protein
VWMCQAQGAKFFGGLAMNTRFVPLSCMAPSHRNNGGYSNGSSLPYLSIIGTSIFYHGKEAPRRQIRFFYESSWVSVPWQDDLTVQLLFCPSPSECQWYPLMRFTSIFQIIFVET